MKIVLVFIGINNKFDEEHEKLVKIQVDNSFRLGFKPEDIILITNFNYEYKKVVATIVGDDNYCYYSPNSSKPMGILAAFSQNLFIENELYWCHDFDLFQLEIIKESDIDISRFDFALCDYGRMPKWSGGSIFFTTKAMDIFEKIKITMDKIKKVDEIAIGKVIDENEGIKKRIKKLNISFNFLPFNIRHCYRMAIKPLKTVHFHPTRGIRQLGVTSAYDFYKGKNKIGTQLVSDNLICLIDYYFNNE